MTRRMNDDEIRKAQLIAEMLKLESERATESGRKMLGQLESLKLECKRARKSSEQMLSELEKQLSTTTARPAAAAHTPWRMRGPTSLVASPVRGIRFWNVMPIDSYGAGYALRSWVMGFYWETPFSRARCANHARPAGQCHCGFWILKPDQARFQPAFANGNRIRRSIAYGVAEGWGTVVDGVWGYRSEYARPIELITFGVSLTGQKSLAERYEVPVSQAKRGWLEVGQGGWERFERTFAHVRGRSIHDVIGDRTT